MDVLVLEPAAKRKVPLCRGIDDLESACPECFENQRRFWCAQTVRPDQSSLVSHAKCVFVHRHAGRRLGFAE